MVVSVDRYREQSHRSRGSPHLVTPGSPGALVETAAKMRALGPSLLAFACVLMMSTQVEGGSPEFIYAIDNITVAAGREAQVNFQMREKI